MGTYATIPAGQSMEAQAGYELYSQDGLWGVTYTSPTDYVNYRASVVSVSESPVYYARLLDSEEYKSLFNISPFRMFNLGLYISNKPFTLYFYQYNTFNTPYYRVQAVDSILVDYNGYSYCVVDAYNASSDDYYTISEYRTGMYNTVSYNNFSSLLSDIGILPYGVIPIEYHLINCSAASAPTEAAIGDTVIVRPQFPNGYGVVNPSSDAYVTCNGVIVPSSYSNGVLTFTMPDPES